MRLKKVLSLLLAIAMVIGMCVPVYADNTLGVTYTAELDNKTINVSNEAQTVTVTINASQEITWDSIGFKVVYDAPLVLVDIINTERTLLGAEKTTNQTSGVNGAGWMSESGENETITNICVLTFTVPAGTEAGEYKIGLEHLGITKDYGEIWENEGAVSTTLTIVDPNAPAMPSGWYPITSMDELTTGEYVVVASNGYALDSFSSGWVLAWQPTIENGMVTDAEPYTWTLTVTGSTVTLMDRNDKFIAPKSGNNNGILSGEYSWAVSCTNGAFTFAGSGSDTTRLASNTASENKFRSYKNTTVSGSPDKYPSEFTLYKWVEGSGETPEVCTHENTDAVPNNNGTHNKVCIACNAVVVANEACSGGEATCTAKAKCSLCGGEYGNLANHNYVNGTCTACGDKETNFAGRYYIATIRTEGNYWYMTNDLGTASTKRYQAVDSGLTELPEEITAPTADKIFVLEKNEDGTYSIYAEGIEGDAKYLGWTSGNSGTLVAKDSALKLTVELKEDLYNIHFTGDEERYLSLNSTAGSDYFAWYKGTQKQDLVLIPVDGEVHTCTGTVTPGKDATCGADGWKDYYTCACGKLYKDAECTTEITLEAWKAGDGKIPATGAHSDAENDGDHKCDVCGKENITTCSGGTATCQAPATCTDCGQPHGEKNPDNHIGNATGSYRNNGNGTHTAVSTYECGHSVDGATGNCSDGNDADELCDSCGNNLHVCTHDHYTTENDKHQSICACGKPIGETVACSGGEATCTEQAKCEICGTYYGEKEAHGYATGFHYSSDGVGTGTHTKCCKDCGAAIEGEKNVACSDVTIKDHMCDICGATLSQCADFNNDHKCDECGETTSSCVDSDKNHKCDFAGCNTDMGEHKSNAAYPCLDGICEYCKATMPATEGHTYENYTSNNDATCTEDGTETGTCKCGATDTRTATGTKLNHTYENYTYNNDATCTKDGTETGTCKCGATDTRTVTGTKLNHTYENYTSNNDATCTEDGTETGTCKCGATNTRVDLNSKLNHTYENYTYNNDATCTEDGTETGTCKCGATDTRTATGTKLNHTYENYTYNNDATCTKDGTETGTCKCGATDTRTVTGTKLNHTYENGSCVCGDKLTGWDGTIYYEGGVKVSGWKEVAGAWYYFGENGYTTGAARVPYRNNAMYPYYNEDWNYAQAHNKEFIDEELTWYLFDENGVLSNFTGIHQDGRYYVAGMAYWHPGFVEVDGEWYYFVGDPVNGGNKAAQGQIYVTRNAEDAGYKTSDQLVFVNGKVDTSVDGIVNGYYYEDGKLACGKGLVKLENGEYIYVRSSGQLAMESYYLPKGLELAHGLYSIDANGYIINPMYSNFTGIKDGYYYVNGKLNYAGLIEIEGDIYYVRSNGQLATGTYWATKTNGLMDPGKYEFDTDGKMLQDGIYKAEDNTYFYCLNGQKQIGTGIVKLADENGVYYIYVRSNGQLATGEYYITTTNDIAGFVKGQKVIFGEDGKYYPAN